MSEEKKSFKEIIYESINKSFNNKLNSIQCFILGITCGHAILYRESFICFLGAFFFPYEYLGFQTVRHCILSKDLLKYCFSKILKIPI